MNELDECLLNKRRRHDRSESETQSERATSDRRLRDNSERPQLEVVFEFPKFNKAPGPPLSPFC